MSKEIEKLRIIDPKIKTTTIRHLRKEDSITLEDFVDDWIKSNPETDQDCCVEWMFLNKLYNNLVGLFIGNTLVSVAAIKETTYLDVPITYKEHAEIMFIGTKSEFQNQGYSKLLLSFILWKANFSSNGFVIETYDGATSSLCKKLSFKEIPGNKEKLEGELTILFFTYPKDK